MDPNYYNQMYGGGQNNLANAGTQYDGGQQLGSSFNDPSQVTNSSGGQNAFTKMLNNPNFGGFAGGAASLLSGFLGEGADPYSAAMNQYQQWNQKAANAQNPYLQAGQGAIGNYQNWLQSMKNPAQFQNNLMIQYQESPWAKYQQQQAMRAAQNAGSASGMLGSSPLTLQEQQNASNISSGDMNNWIQNVLGINTQYGQGQANLMGQGQNAANALTKLYGQEAAGMADLGYNQAEGQNQDQNNMIGGVAQMLPFLASL